MASAVANGCRYATLSRGQRRERSWLRKDELSLRRKIHSRGSDTMWNAAPLVNVCDFSHTSNGS